MRACSVTIAVSLSLLSLVISPAALAQATRSGGSQQQNAQALQQMQRLAAERAALQAENTRLKQELEAATKRAGTAGSQEEALKRRAQTAEATSTRLAASSAANAESAARMRTQMDDLVSKFRETAQTLKQAEAERNELRQSAAAAEQKLKTCHDHNAELLTINEEVLVRLENTGLWTKLAADEPFTRLKRTELENLADQYRARATELAVTPQPASKQ